MILILYKFIDPIKLSINSCDVTKKHAYSRWGCFKNDFLKDIDSKKWLNNMNNLEHFKKWLKIPNLRPMMKLHEKDIEYRRIINASNWYSSFLSIWWNKGLEASSFLIQEKLSIYIILQNSFKAINK